MKRTSSARPKRKAKATRQAKPPAAKAHLDPTSRRPTDAERLLMLSPEATAAAREMISVCQKLWARSYVDGNAATSPAASASASCCARRHSSARPT